MILDGIFEFVELLIRVVRYLYHRITKKPYWRIFYLSPQWNTFGNKSGSWLVSPRMPRKYAKMYTRGFFSHIHYDPGPDDWGTKEPEYPPIPDSMRDYPDGAQDVAYYHWKYKSELWGQ